MFTRMVSKVSIISGVTSTGISGSSVPIGGVIVGDVGVARCGRRPAARTSSASTGDIARPAAIKWKTIVGEVPITTVVCSFSHALYAGSVRSCDFVPHLGVARSRF